MTPTLLDTIDDSQLLTPVAVPSVAAVTVAEEEEEEVQQPAEVEQPSSSTSQPQTQPEPEQKPQERKDAAPQPKSARARPFVPPLALTARSETRPQTARPRLTQARSPMFRTTSRVGRVKTGPSTEELMLQKAKREAEELRRKKLQTQKLKEKALRPQSAPAPRVSAKPLTQVAEFKLRTETRVKSDPSQQKTFVSTAQLVEKFQKQTPRRFRTKPAHKVPYAAFDSLGTGGSEC